MIVREKMENTQDHKIPSTDVEGAEVVEGTEDAEYIEQLKASMDANLDLAETALIETDARIKTIRALITAMSACGPAPYYKKN